jgi:enoyl-CoA hydratase/carnithine racemase
MKLNVTKHSPAYWTATFNNPPVNLLDPEVISALRVLMDEMESAPELKVIVFNSSNPDFFIAHLDLLRAGEGSKDVGPTGLLAWPDLTTRMSRVPVISIASIRGRARGVGSEFALACDIRFGSLEKMILGQIEVGLGVLPGGGGSEWLPILVGRSRALEIIASSEDYDATTAERYGWINRAIPDAELDGFVDRLARRIASFDKGALTAAKRVVNRSSRLPEDTNLLATYDEFVRALAAPAATERVTKSLAAGLQTDGKFERNLGSELLALNQS